MFLFCLSKAVRREPGHGLFDQLGDIRAVGRDDGLHPNAAGAKVIAEAVFRTLCNNSGKESDEQEMK